MCCFTMTKFSVIIFGRDIFVKSAKVVMEIDFSDGTFFDVDILRQYSERNK